MTTFFLAGTNGTVPGFECARRFASLNQNQHFLYMYLVILESEQMRV